MSPATEGRHHLVTPSGLLFGLAVATKYQAWLFLPLLAGLAWLNGWSWPAWRRWLAGFVPILMLVGLWQVARTGPALWAAQMANYGGLRLAWSWELWPRLLAWGDQWRLAVGSMLWLVALAVALVIVAFRHTRDRTRAIDQLLLLYLAGYLLLHWLLAVPIWDRYLLPLIPLAALIFGRGMQEIVSASAAIRLPSIAWRGERRWLLLSFLLLLFQLPVADQARHGRFPIGGQPAADQGAAHVAVFLADAAYGTVLYDHWYSWQWRYHLFDSRVHVSWFPYPDALAEDLAVFGRASASRYLALPDAAAALPVKRAVTAAGFSLHPVPLQTQTGIILYQILPQEVIR